MAQATNELTLTDIADPAELLLLDEDSPDDLLEPALDEDEGKPEKGRAAATRRRAATQTKKKHYTEDSIRLYLQEIGRIRLLRADEEIELARKIADLLELERLREQLVNQLDREPQDIEWAEEVLYSQLEGAIDLHKRQVKLAKVVQDQLPQIQAKHLTNQTNKSLSFSYSCYLHLLELLVPSLQKLKESTEKEWLKEVSKQFPAFRHRLFVGRRAKEKMVQSNLRLVVSIAKKYMNRGLSFQDLIQEGSLGLIRAAEKFDHEKGYKFSTYATWWIRQAITRAIADQSRTIRLPVHLYETISRIKKTTKILSQEMGRKPTEEEIADRMEMTIEKLRFIAKSAQFPISLETPIGKEEDSRLGDFIEADGETPEDQVSKNLLREDLETVLNSLSARERDVLRLRYGLDDGRMKTLEEIGTIFNVTRERIRQIEAKALRKLRHPNRNTILKEYIR